MHQSPERLAIFLFASSKRQSQRRQKASLPNMRGFFALMRQQLLQQVQLLSCRAPRAEGRLLLRGSPCGARSPGEPRGARGTERCPEQQQQQWRHGAVNAVPVLGLEKPQHPCKLFLCSQRGNTHAEPVLMPRAGPARAACGAAAALPLQDSCATSCNFASYKAARNLCTNTEAAAQLLPAMLGKTSH